MRMKHQVHFIPVLTNPDWDIAFGDWSGLDMTHKIDSYDDWKLIPTVVVSIVPPTQKTTYVDIPGASGSLDMSTSLTGWPLYSDREGTMTFYLDDDTVHREEQYHKIANYFNRFKNKFYFWTDDDPDYFFKGSIFVSAFDPVSTPRTSITLTYRFEPYRRAKEMTLHVFKDLGNAKTNFNFDDVSPYDIGSMPTRIKIGADLKMFSGAQSGASKILKANITGLKGGTSAVTSTDITPAYDGSPVVYKWLQKTMYCDILSTGVTGTITPTSEVSWLADIYVKWRKGEI